MQGETIFGIYLASLSLDCYMFTKKTKNRAMVGYDDGCVSLCLYQNMHFINNARTFLENGGILAAFKLVLGLGSYF